MDDRFAELDRRVPAAGLLGYLNFSDGRPDPRWQRQLNDAYAFLADHGFAEPWRALPDWLTGRLAGLRGIGAAFRDTGQTESVLALLPAVLAAYRAHHADLLFHQTDRELFQPFFLARALEAVLAQGGPWGEQQRVVAGALAKLNDFVGYRPVAVLETRPRGEPYDHERVRPVPLYLRGAAVAWGRYHDLVRQALDILAEAEPVILQEAGFDLRLLDELAFDPRAYDHGHPVNRRPNYVFGEWDPHHLDDQGRYRRYVVRQILLDGLLERVENRGPLERGELLFEAAAVLAGTILMGAGISGPSPTAHDSSASLSALMPGIARYRDAFYVHLLQARPAAHAARLRQEQATTRQPFGGARQHLNQFLARHRAAQLQQRFLALLFAEMGFPEASREEAARIPAASARMLSEVLGRLTRGQLAVERGELAEAADVLPEVEDLLRRGIGCGALADPWNVLGFQALFPLSPAREDSVRDQRLDELIQVLDALFNLHARLSSEAAAAGDRAQAAATLAEMERLAAWWDQFATIEVGDVRRVAGREALESARHVSAALASWHERGEAAGDLAFWRGQLEGLRSPKAFALCVDALLRKKDFRAAMALLVNWLGQAEQVPLEDGEYSFHALALRWMLSAAGPDGGNPALVAKFFDYLEANAEDYWQVPELDTAAGSEGEPDSGNGDELYSAAYEGMTYRDSTDDDVEGEVVGGDQPREAFDLEGEGEVLGRRLRFLSTLARLWQIAARMRGPSGERSAGADALPSWLKSARENERRLLRLLDALHAYPVPEPTGSYESLVEFDRRRVLKEQLVYGTVGTCLDNFLAVGSLQGALGAGESEAGEDDRPAWEPQIIALEQAFLRGDPAAVRVLLPAFLERFRDEPLLFTPLAEGGEPRQVLRVRIAQTVVRALATSLPRLGLLRETYGLLRLARDMEQTRRPARRGVTEFNQLFQAAYQAVVQNVVHSAAAWQAPQTDDHALVEVLEALTAPFLALWAEHSQTLQLSVLEALDEGAWDRLRRFVQRYGGDLFHARFMTLANLRGILHRGVGPYFDYLRDNADPLHPVKLLDELDEHVPRAEAEVLFRVAIQAVVENYEEYKDYNATTAQSDYGENLHVLLDALRLKAAYERNAWQFRPLVMAHEVLARAGRNEAAVLWQEAFAELTQEPAAAHLEALARLEKTHFVRLGTVSDRLHERFVRPLAVDRLCALIEPAMKEAQAKEPGPSFTRLRQELQEHASRPTGVGLDVPQWLRQLEGEVRRVRASQSSVALLAGGFFQLPERALGYEELRQQMLDWEQEAGPG